MTTGQLTGHRIIHLEPPEHVGDILREQVSVCDDARLVPSAALFRERHQAAGKRFDDVGREQRLAAEPGDVDVLRP